jgi:predicted  nucleic acid-binding Zn-ribbon protein
MCPVTDADLTLRLLRALDEKIDALRADMNRRFERIDRRFDEVDGRFGDVDRRFDDVDRKIDNTNNYLVSQNARLGTEISAVRGAYHEIEPKQAQLEDRVEVCEREIEEIKKRDD